MTNADGPIEGMALAIAEAKYLYARADPRRAASSAAEMRKFFHPEARAAWAYALAWLREAGEHARGFGIDPSRVADFLDALAREHGLEPLERVQR